MVEFIIIVTNLFLEILFFIIRVIALLIDYLIFQINKYCFIIKYTFIKHFKMTNKYGKDELQKVINIMWKA